MIRAYFYAPETSKPALLAAYDAIKAVCARADVVLSTNTEKREANLPTDTIAQLDATGVPLLSAMQAIVVEGSTPDPRTGYLLASALAEQKPLLYLYTRGEVAPDVLRYLNLKDIPRHITVATYTSRSLDDVVVGFLEKLGDVRVREAPRIKFTLRLTRTMDEYLDFKTRNTKVSKADYLREQLDRLMAEDEAFRRFLRKHGTA